MCDSFYLFADLNLDSQNNIATLYWTFQKMRPADDNETCLVHMPSWIIGWQKILLNEYN